jgi:hypothetical protein
VNTKIQPYAIWAAASVTLTVGTAMSAILAAMILDTLVERPEPASITTLIPGSAYAVATVMKVCILTGLVAAVIALLRRVSGYGVEGPPSAPPLARHAFPMWGIMSITFAPLTPFVGALAVVIAQELADKPAGLSLSDLSQVSRTAVFVKLSFISVGAISAVTSLVRRERPILLPALSLAINSLLIGLFWHLEFFALGFDQDTWAPR